MAKKSTKKSRPRSGMMAVVTVKNEQSLWDMESLGLVTSVHGFEENDLVALMNKREQRLMRELYSLRSSMKRTANKLGVEYAPG